MASSSFPPLLPKLDAILVLDGEGNRLAGKYYGDFMKVAPASPSAPAENGGADSDNATAAQGVEQLRASFERQLQSKIGGIAAAPDAAEVVTVLGKTAVFCGGSSPASKEGGAPASAAADVRVVHVGPPGESELVLAHLVEGMYDALGQLMGGATDRNMILDNLELVFLLIDEHCDGGLILETDGHRLSSSVLLRDDPDGRADPAAEAQGAAPEPAQASRGGLSMGMGGLSGDMTIAQALMQARNQIISNLSQS